MYKKAGIVIAVILVAAGILAISISSCRGDDLVKVNNLNNTSAEVTEQQSVNQDSEIDQNIEEVEQSSKVPVTTQSELPVDTTKESSVESTDKSGGTDTSIVESKSEEKPKEQSKIESSTESSTSSEDQSLLEELSEYSKENSNSESKVEVTSEVSKQQDEFTNEFIEIEKDSLKYESTDKEMLGVVKGTKMFYCNDCLYTSIVILGEDGASYTYFVPLETYEGLKTGTKLKMKVRIYFDEGVSMSQILSVEIA